jgi:integrase
MASPKEITIFPKSPDKAGFVRLHMYVSINNNPGWYPTKVKCLKEYWSQNEQKIKSGHIDYKKLNGILRTRLGQLQQAFDNLEYEKTVADVELIREKYNSIINHEAGKNGNDVKKKNYRFLEFADLYIKERSAYRSKGYLRQFKATKTHVSAIIPDPTFEQINMEFYAELLRHLIEDLELENNTIYGIVKRIKTIMGAALIDPRTKHLDIPLDFKLFDDLYTKPKMIWVDWETELPCLESFVPLPEDLPILQFWLFLCYTGLRHSDAFKLRPENFIRKKDAVFLDHTIVKTKLDHNIELTPKAVEILKLWKFKVPRIYAHDLNAGIKRIACAAGKKWELDHQDSPLLQLVEKVRFSGSERVVSVLPKCDLITTHTARRSLGRRWAERKGDLQLLQHYYGHSNLQQTLDYIGWTTAEANSEMIRIS